MVTNQRLPNIFLTALSITSIQTRLGSYLKVFPDQDGVEVELERRKEIKLDAGRDEDARCRVGPGHWRHLHEGLTNQRVERHCRLKEPLAARDEQNKLSDGCSKSQEATEAGKFS